MREGLEGGRADPPGFDRRHVTPVDVGDVERRLKIEGVVDDGRVDEEHDRPREHDERCQGRGFAARAVGDEQIIGARGQAGVPDGLQTRAAVTGGHARGGVGRARRLVHQAHLGPGGEAAPGQLEGELEVRAHLARRHPRHRGRRRNAKVRGVGAALGHRVGDDELVVADRRRISERHLDAERAASAGRDERAGNWAAGGVHHRCRDLDAVPGHGGSRALDLEEPAPRSGEDELLGSRAGAADHRGLDRGDGEILAPVEGAAGQQAAVGVVTVGVVAVLELLHHAVPAVRQRAVAATRVSVEGVAVVAGLDPGPLHAVAAGRGGAVRAAGVGIGGVAVVAILPGLEETVPAGRADAGVQAGVSVAGVAVVARLRGLDQAVTAAREGAVARAGVSVEAVAVVALLDAATEHAVSTGGEHAGRQAAVAVVVVAVIALLVVLHHAVPAAGGRAVAPAAVAIVLVAVVAILDPEPQEPIAANSQGAVVQAGVLVAGVAVVALLARLHGAVPAARLEAAVGAVVGVVPIAVVALLAGLHHAVPAGRQGAVVAAAVAIVLVAVVAGLEPTTHDPIAADGEGAVVQAGVVRVEVAVIAGFVTLHDPVSAARLEAAGGALVAVAQVAVVALLAVLHHAVPAAGRGRLLVVAATPDGRAQEDAPEHAPEQGRGQAARRAPPNGQSLVRSPDTHRFSRFLLPLPSPTTVRAPPDRAASCSDRGVRCRPRAPGRAAPAPPKGRRLRGPSPTTTRIRRRSPARSRRRRRAKCRPRPPGRRSPRHPRARRRAGFRPSWCRWGR